MIFVALWKMEGEVHTCFQNIRQNSWRLVYSQTGQIARLCENVWDNQKMIHCGIKESITNCLEVLGNKWEDGRLRK